MMTKQSRQVTEADIISLEQYSQNRKKLRTELIEFNKNRRVTLGPYATFYFECSETMLAQIQEMLYIEKGGNDQLADELRAYNPLIPKGNELIATLMFEIDNPVTRSDFLGKVGGIEEKIYLEYAFALSCTFFLIEPQNNVMSKLCKSPPIVKDFILSINDPLVSIIKFFEYLD